MADDKMVTYLVKHANGTEQKITVPDSWKVTFGPLALRFYENETKQRAIFTDVISFRDMSIGIEEKREHVEEKAGFVECDGKRKQTVFQARVVEWVNPDQIKDEGLPALPKDSEMFDLAESVEE